MLAGWLCRTARFAACNAIKAEYRRQQREQMAVPMDNSSDATWLQLAPLLDEAVAQLNDMDRNAVVLRFYERKPLNEVGIALGIDPDAAQKRVSRAVDKLRKFFVKRGVALSVVAIGSALLANAVQAAPAGLAVSVTAAAAKGAAVSSSTLTLIKGALKIMAWTKAKTAIVVGAGVLLAAGTTTVTVKKIEARDAWRVYPGDIAALNRVPPQVRILPAKFPQSGLSGASGGKMLGIGQTIKSMAQVAYASPSEHNWDNARTIVSANIPQGRYDFIANLPTGSWIALQKEMERKLGMVGRRETRETDVLQLTVKRPNAPGLKPSTARWGGDSGGDGEVNGTGSSINDVAYFLERTLGLPVVDHTGLTGKFDYNLKWNKHDPEHDNLKQALLDQLGLELVPGSDTIEMLVVEKAP